MPVEIFEIAPLNPLRFLPDGERDLFYRNQDDKCYFQKFTRTDVTKLQILSDFTDIDCVIRHYEDNSLALTLNVVAVPISIIGQTFLCYEIEFDFSNLLPGKYYVELTYTEVSGDIHTFYSEPLDVQDEHPGTIVFNYSNSENNFSVIFDTSIEFLLRVEGTIKEFTPVADDVIYNDQVRNATLLNSIPYRTYKLYVGNAGGLPDWMTDKVNRVMSCDEKDIDGESYEKIEGAKWEVNRAIEYPFSGINIEIMPVDNIFYERLKTGDQPPQGYTIVEKVQNYFANGADIDVLGVFRKYSLLKHISVINNGAAYTMSVGTTPGGNDIGVFDVPDGSGGAVGITFNIKWIFLAATDVYISGLTGTNSDVMIDYLQYDETPVNPIPAPPVNMPKCAVVRFEEVVPGDFATAFNLGTGLGNAGTGWEDWAVKDGRNGTVDEGGRVPVSWVNNPASPYYVVGDTGGAEEVNISVSQLPPHTHQFTYDDVGRANGGATTMRNYPGSNVVEETGITGDGDPVSIMQPYIVALWVKKIA